jgi:ribonuclease HI
VERDEPGHSLNIQRHIYFMSEVLSDTRLCYPQIQKLIYAVLIAKRKLLHYFESHRIMVVSLAALGDVIQNRDASGRVAKWATRLMGHHITYVLRTAIKSQILADFVAEWTETQTPPPPIRHEYWTLYFDGSLMGTGVGAGVILVSPSGDCLRYTIRLLFTASNNMAEYEALIHGLRITSDLGARRIYVRGHSKLVMDQVMKDASCQDDKMAAYCQEDRKLEERFDGIELHQILGMTTKQPTSWAS